MPSANHKIRAFSFFRRGNFCLFGFGGFGCFSRRAFYSAQLPINRRSRRRSLMAEGLLARCIQHECDHLDGRLFIDIAVSLRKEEKKG